MFCLESVKSVELAFNPIGCPCQFKSHGACLHAWFEEKHQYECPICHTVSVPNPVQPVYQIVYVQRDEPVNRSFYPLIPQRHQQCVGVCCLGFLLWWLALTIIELIFKK